MPQLDPPDRDGGDDVPGTGVTARLDRWVADARIDDAARRRTSERWLRQQAEEEASFAGVLVDLAERGAVVTVHVGTQPGRAHRGLISLVGRDFVRVEVPGAGAVLVASAMVSSVRIDRAGTPVTGDRAVTTQLALAEVLTGLAAERERALFVPAGGWAPVCGTVESVGQDVVVVRTDGEAGPGGLAYLPLPRIGEVVPGM
jgi:hypothetical protein